MIINTILVNLCEQFNGLEFKIFSGTGSLIFFEVYNVPRSFFDEIDIELSAQKYNL
jgi:hypothetical protein